MKVTVKKLSELKRPKRNVRMHTDKQLVEFRRSVEMFGQIRPLVVDENGTILAGNGLYETLLSLGRDVADCYVVRGLTENEKKKLMLADNRVFDLGVDDMSAFDDLIAELGDDLDIPGYDDDMLRSLVASAEDVDSIIAEYGLVDDDQKAKMQKAHEEYEKEKTERPPVMAPPCDDQEREEDDAGTDETQPIGRYVVCPKCGEKIWL